MEENSRLESSRQPSCHSMAPNGWGQQQKNTFNEQQQKAAADKRNTAASPANGRASKKIRKSYDDEDEDVIGGI